MASDTAQTTTTNNNNKKDDESKEWLTPAQRHNMTETEKRQRELDRLFTKIDTPIHIPEQLESKTRKTRDFVANVSGSSAGAGSGDFHVYRALRRREYTRLGNMEAEENKERKNKAYHDEIDRKKAEDDERTAKKRARRQKRKQNQSDKKDKDTNKKQKTEDDKN